MAWNEPGSNGNDNDPWGGGRRGGDQGPPDIDQVIKNLTKKFNGLFGGSRGGGSSAGGGSSSPRRGISGGKFGHDGCAKAYETHLYRRYCCAGGVVPTWSDGKYSNLLRRKERQERA